MARVKRGVTTHARHKKVLEQSKGFFGRSSTNYRIALERLEKSLQYAYRDRRTKKRDFRGALDPAHQRRGARAWHDLLAIYRRAEERRDRDGPQSAGGHRLRRSGKLRRDRQEGAGRPGLIRRPKARAIEPQRAARRQGAALLHARTRTMSDDLQALISETDGGTAPRRPICAPGTRCASACSARAARSPRCSSNSAACPPSSGASAARR